MYKVRERVSLVQQWRSGRVWDLQVYFKMWFQILAHSKTNYEAEEGQVLDAYYSLTEFHFFKKEMSWIRSRVNANTRSILWKGQMTADSRVPHLTFYSWFLHALGTIPGRSSVDKFINGI